MALALAFSDGVDRMCAACPFLPPAVTGAVAVTETVAVGVAVALRRRMITLPHPHPVPRQGCAGRSIVQSRRVAGGERYRLGGNPPSGAAVAPTATQGARGRAGGAAGRGVRGGQSTAPLCLGLVSGVSLVSCEERVQDVYG